MTDSIQWYNNKIIPVRLVCESGIRKEIIQKNSAESSCVIYLFETFSVEITMVVSEMTI